jgi:DNA mismatch endonuclease (patch repair protein)
VARPSFKGRTSASAAATAAARGSSKKSDTKHELVLRRELWARGLRYRKDVTGLPGRPDIVFRSARVIVFCDGDFWHGRNWEDRKQKLRGGHNAPYWLAKIERNMERDLARTKLLESEGWTVLRFWETDVLRDPCPAADQIESAVAASAASSSTPLEERLQPDGSSARRS